MQAKRRLFTRRKDDSECRRDACQEPLEKTERVGGVQLVQIVDYQHDRILEQPQIRQQLVDQRLAGALTAVRAEDLRFSAEGTRQLLEASGIALSDEGVALLCDRTEGWAAGLRLAAISLAGHAEPERFVREFSGSERTVAGYLLAEVLERQPPEARELLLNTSLLERVSGPLADSLTGASRSERILQSLADANAFVTALDAGRSWFR